MHVREDQKKKKQWSNQTSRLWLVNKFTVWKLLLHVVECVNSILFSIQLTG